MEKRSLKRPPRIKTVEVNEQGEEVLVIKYGTEDENNETSKV